MPVRTKAASPAPGETVIAVGERMVTAYGGAALDGLGPEGFLFETRQSGKGKLLLVAGPTPRGTNAGLATLLPLVKGGRGTLYVDGSLDRARRRASRSAAST